MHADVRTRRGRLTREDQRRLGDLLKRVYDDVIHEGVPDRFRALLDEINAPEAERASGPRETEAAGGYHPSGDEREVKTLHNRGSSE
jgi:hypothetical protein